MLDGVINLLGVVVTIVNIINVKQNNVEKDAATQRISRTQVRQKRKHVQTNLLVNRLHLRQCPPPT